MGSKRHERLDDSPNRQLDMFGYEGHFEKMSHQLKADLAQERKDHAVTKADLAQERKDHAITQKALDQERKDHAVTQKALGQKNKDNADMLHANSKLSFRCKDLGDRFSASEERNTVLEDRLSRMRTIMDEDLADCAPESGEMVSAASDSLRHNCFKFENDLIKEKLRAIIKECYHGSHTNLALIEIALFDHSILKKRNKHTAFVKTLMDWGLIDNLSGKDLENLTGGISYKSKRMPMKGYLDWGRELANDRIICEKVGLILGASFPYKR